MNTTDDNQQNEESQSHGDNRLTRVKQSLQLSKQTLGRAMDMFNESGQEISFSYYFNGLKVQSLGKGEELACIRCLRLFLDYDLTFT